MWLTSWPHTTKFTVLFGIFGGHFVLVNAMPSISIQTAATIRPSPLPSAALFELAKPALTKGFDSSLKPCPVTCSDSGINPNNWTTYHDTKRLEWCNETMLLDFTVHNDLSDQNTVTSIRSCSANASADKPNQNRRSLERDVSCVPAKNSVNLEASLKISSSGSQAQSFEVIAAAQQLLVYLDQKEPECNSTIIFTRSGQATVGLFAGYQIFSQGIATSVLQHFIDQLKQEEISESVVVQLCGGHDRGSDFALGIAANTNSNISSVQGSVAAWSKGECVTSFDRSVTWMNTTFWAPVPSQLETNSSSINTTSTTTLRRSSLKTRSDCTTIQVASGDSCASLATKCAISGASFTTYNPGSNLCSTLQPGQHVCCSAGTLPNFAPQPNPDGSCATYLVVSGDYCALIASKNSITVTQIESFNNQTWGWTGCNNLFAGVNMCLSTGTPPMPAPITNAVCGPQVPNTPIPPAGTALASLNPCLLNACCDIWGQCGTTDEFCTASESATGAPGTAAPGTNGCISNCGSGIVMGTPPAEFMKIAYFEGFNIDSRSCDIMDIREVPFANYTHIHMAFATIGYDFSVNVTGIEEQFGFFTLLTGNFKKILSFGGWSFSTDQDTYAIFRESVSDANRQTFINQLVNFVENNSLDGLDFDWEYPGAPDIPGIPPGDPLDGTRYFEFLYGLRQALPAKYSLSIAAPASYWYLKGFPIEAISFEVDYIVYMTYDLHGQWDYGNAWSDPGCPGGNCLRSHINLTETINALSMITKAGVPSGQVVVGVTSYGRSFEMTTPGCVDELCTYTGPLSGATPGVCTQTAGYIANAEIQAIIDGGNVLTYNDDTFSNILVYNTTQWVAYMDDTNKAQRTELYQNYHFGGVTDWAVDLTADGISSNYTDPTNDDFNASAPCDYTQVFASLTDLEAVAGTFSVYCAELYAVQTLSMELQGALTNFTDVNNGYDKLFTYYVQYITDLVPGVLNNFMLSSDGPGNKYFDCTWNQGGVNTTTRVCPFPESNLDEDYYSLYFTLINSTGFYSDLENNYGIDASWVTFGDRNIITTCSQQQVKNGCAPKNIVWHGFPIEVSKIVVTNPKDLITQAGPNMSQLQNKIDATWMDQIMGQWDGSGLDLIQVLAMPVALIQQAIQSMATVKALGQAQDDNDKKNLILEIVTAVLAVVPFLGDAAASAAGLATLARALSIIGEVANTGLTLYSIVEDPNSAPMAIFGMLLGALSLPRNEASFATMGAQRRSMTADDVANIGALFETQSTTIQKITKSCSL